MIDLPFAKNRSYAVMGLGRTGKAAARALKAGGATVFVWDDGEKARTWAVAEGFTVTELTEEVLRGVDDVVWSPGIPHSLPHPHPMAEAARDAGVDLITDIDLLGRADPDAKVVAITGTNGKSTTTALIAHVLTELGEMAKAGGNIGMPVLEGEALGKGGIHVLELSSYQTELLRDLSPEIAVFLNLTPDHLDRHGDMSGYLAAKARLMDAVIDGGVQILGIDQEPTAALAATLDAEERTVVLTVGEEGQITIGDDGFTTPDGSRLDLTGTAALRGRHNAQNAAAAFAAAAALGHGTDAIFAAIRSFPGLRHRQEIVATIDGVTYINDTKATNAEAAATALSAFDNIHWIAGGRMKEGGIGSLAPFFPRINHAYLIGECAMEFAATLQGKVGYDLSETLRAAVANAHDRAHAGEVVLLSPAAASFDQFTGFEARGDAFRDLVHGLKEAG
ncbi:MAG: UDP-N-acetylmuramoyl-L-alanine--D-glutamate ligase [Alphaproteobacteria bacterium]|nr:UDP-N-acetylmuramoyl-L-alanine--D-glutamate ligase [Alphaproteobacteria bacterium]